MEKLITQYKLPMIFGGLGLILAILFVTLGFQDTLDRFINSAWHLAGKLFRANRHDGQLFQSTKEQLMIQSSYKQTL